MEDVHYEVWVTLEKWNGTENIEDCEATKIADIQKREDAEVIKEACESLCLTITPIIATKFNLDIES